MKRLAKCAVALTLAFTSLAASAKIVVCPELNNAQVKVLHETWRYGEEKIGKGWGARFSAIAYQETKLGKDVHGSGSYGLFQMQPATVAYLMGRKSASGLKHRLLTDHNFSMQMAEKYIAYWQEKGYDVPKIYSRYNGGYSNSARSHKYAAEVHAKAKMFQTCKARFF